MTVIFAICNVYWFCSTRNSNDSPSSSNLLISSTWIYFLICFNLLIVVLLRCVCLIIKAIPPLSLEFFFLFLTIPTLQFRKNSMMVINRLVDQTIVDWHQMRMVSWVKNWIETPSNIEKKNPPSINRLRDQHEAKHHHFIPSITTSNTSIK